jgi:hypothetical protein
VANHRQRTEEGERMIVNAADGAPQLGIVVLDLAEVEHAFGVAHEIGDAIVADRASEILRGDVFEVVRFVDDRVVTVRDHFAVGALTHRRISAQQVMIDNHHIRFGRLLPHARDVALTILRAVAAEAGFGEGRHVVPQR